MKVTLLQTDIAWNEPQANISRAEELMAQAGPADLYVLPEMWATGFAVQPEGVAETEATSTALAWMKRTARQQDCALSGSLAVQLADGSCRNRHYFVTPASVTCYDKHHLFTYGHEHLRYTAGSNAVVASWKGWRMLLLTCYDLRFPVFSRYGRPLTAVSAPTALTTDESAASMLDYDAIVCVANWPERRQVAWDTLIRARAIENQCYMVAVNRVGSDAQCTYAGGSAIIDPTGRALATCQPGHSSATAELPMEQLRHMRAHFPVLSDRDAISPL